MINESDDDFLKISINYKQLLPVTQQVDWSTILLMIIYIHINLHPYHHHVMIDNQCYPYI